MKLNHKGMLKAKLLYKAFKLYKMRYKAGHNSDFERFKEFLEFYKEYGVQIVGGGVNVDNPLENYLITTYRDKTHYTEDRCKAAVRPKIPRIDPANARSSRKC